MHEYLVVSMYVHDATTPPHTTRPAAIAPTAKISTQRRKKKCQKDERTEDSK